MKRIDSLLLICVFSVTCLMTSCKKGGNGGDNPPAEEKIDPTNAKAVSAAIKVWHGERKTGTVTASANPDRPVIDPSQDGEEIIAIAGRYAIIQPNIISGTLGGYYVEVEGAGEYFDVDYTKPRQIPRKDPALARASQLLRSKLLQKGQDDPHTGGVLDSAIVITIPENIKTGTFCIKYYAHDLNGVVGDPVETCITVAPYGGDASTAFLAGKWKAHSYKDINSTQWVPQIYGWDINLDSFFCTGATVDVEGIPYYQLSNECPGNQCESFIDTANAIRTDYIDYYFAA
ncbi:MAG: hypothetical protein EOO88_63545, partial [Pedobacter sp.]